MRKATKLLAQPKAEVKIYRYNKTSSSPICQLCAKLCAKSIACNSFFLLFIYALSCKHIYVLHALNMQPKGKVKIYRSYNKTLASIDNHRLFPNFGHDGGDDHGDNDVGKQHQNVPKFPKRTKVKLF